MNVVSALSEAMPDRRILAVEPHVDALPASLGDRSNVALVSLAHAMREAVTVVLLVDHQAFGTLSLGDLRTKKLVDTRGIWSTRTI